MTYHATLSAEGAIALPEDLVRALGMKPGDSVSVDRSGSGIVIRQDDGRSAAIARLRTAAHGDERVQCGAFPGRAKCRLGRMTKVVDSSVVLAALLGERGGEILDEPDQLFHLSMVNRLIR